MLDVAIAEKKKDKPKEYVGEKLIEYNEHQLFLQHQTDEQFALSKQHGWKIAKMLTEPEPNFSYE